MPKITDENACTCRMCMRLKACKDHGLNTEQINFAMMFLRDLTEEEFVKIKNGTIGNLSKLEDA